MNFFSPGVTHSAHLLALVATVACSKPSAAPSAQDRVALQAGLDSAANRLLTALRNDNPDSLLALMADDLLLMPPNEPVLKGKVAVRTWYEHLLTQLRTNSLIVTDREVRVDGDLATEVATFEWALAPVAGGSPVSDRGHYIQVWRHEPDGRWLLSREMWNSTIPIPAASQ